MYLLQRLLDPARMMLAVFALALAMPLPVKADYLDDPEMFRVAWAKLLGAVGETDLYMVHIQPLEIGVQAPSNARETHLKHWSVEHRTWLFGAWNRLSPLAAVRRSAPSPASPHLIRKCSRNSMLVLVFSSLSTRSSMASPGFILL